MKPSEAVEKYGSQSAAARALNMDRSTFRGRLDAERRNKSGDNVLTFPELPDRREPIESLLKRRAEHFGRQKAHAVAATWQQIKVADKKPIGLVLMGDPHIDDDGCDVPALLDDIAYLNATPGMYAVNIGDTTNNWVGRLARLFGNKETSQTSARQLAEWFLTGAGIKWAAVLLGNHDEWNEGGEIIKRMCSAAPARIPVHEWAAKLEFVFPNGATCRVNAAHDFKGRFIYSTTHGPLREAIWYQDGAHILAAGHIHYGGLQQVKIPGGHNPWLVRVRGYKNFDSHALVNGYHEGSRFRSVVAIIDPNAPAAERVSVFGSVRQGAAVLKAMRGEKDADRVVRAGRRGQVNGRKAAKGSNGRRDSSVRSAPKKNGRKPRR